MRQIHMDQPTGQRVWQQLLRRLTADPDAVRGDALTCRVFGKPVSPRQAVSLILEKVRREGDRALRYYTRQLEGVKISLPALRVSEAERRAAEKRVPASLQRSLQECAAHIRTFHQTQVPKKSAGVRRPGVSVQERCLPLDRVGIYVPGGQAPLVSTVLMNALPAAIAGVGEIVMATPPNPQGQLNDAILYAAKLAGVTEVYRLGGAVAVAAFALGTETIRRVDKIVGPGNIFVTEAKRQVAGSLTGIDSLAGPSEILIIADDSADPVALAWDLLGQGEHGSGAIAILLSASSRLLTQVALAAEKIAQEQPALQTALKSVMLVRVRDLDQALSLAQAYAPEHLSLQVARPQACLARVRHCGAAFLGPMTPQAMGDYTAGTNHVLPTGGTARWSSPLSVRDFLRYTSVIQYSAAGVLQESPAAVEVARAEGLTAHAESMLARVRKPSASRKG